MPDVEMDMRGHAGYFIGGMNKQAASHVHGNVGWSVAENIMSGSVRVKGNASECTAASGHGGLVVIEGERLVALRHLDEGLRHRRRRLRRPRLGVHGAGGQSGGLRRRRRPAWATRCTRR